METEEIVKKCEACLTECEWDLCDVCYGYVVNNVQELDYHPNKRKKLTYEQGKEWLVTFMNKVRENYAASFIDKDSEPKKQN